VLIGLLVLVTLVDAFWLVAFLGTLIFDSGDIEGFGDVVAFLIVQLVLTSFWIPLFRAVRGRRFVGPRGFPRRGQWRRFPRAIRPTPTGRHALPTNPSAPRTAITQAAMRDALRLPGAKRNATATVDLPDDGRLGGLARAEQVLGNALYQLDLCRGSHELTKARISELRLTGVEVSALLTTRADPLGPVRMPARQLKDGIRRLTDLALVAERLLVGKAHAADVDEAMRRLAQLDSDS
jgi:hypothetical protein